MVSSEKCTRSMYWTNSFCWSASWYYMNFICVRWKVWTRDTQTCPHRFSMFIPICIESRINLTRRRYWFAWNLVSTYICICIIHTYLNLVHQLWITCYICICMYSYKYIIMHSWHTFPVLFLFFVTLKIQRIEITRNKQFYADTPT